MNNTIAISFNCMDTSQTLPAFVTRGDSDNDECNYRYTHPKTGRIFDVRRSEHGDAKSRYFLCEMCPNGRMFEPNEHGYVRYAWDERRIKEAESRVGPNA